MPTPCNRKARRGPHIRTDSHSGVVHWAIGTVGHHTQPALPHVDQGNAVDRSGRGGHVLGPAVVLRRAVGRGVVLGEAQRG